MGEASGAVDSGPELCGSSNGSTQLVFLTAAWEVPAVFPPGKCSASPTGWLWASVLSVCRPGPECTHAQVSPAKPRPSGSSRQRNHFICGTQG